MLFAKRYRMRKQVVHFSPVVIHTSTDRGEVQLNAALKYRILTHRAAGLRQRKNTALRKTNYN